RVDAGEVALLDPGDRGDLPVRTGEVLGDPAADPAERLAAAFGQGPGRRAGRAAGLADVVLGDPPLRAGAGQPLEVYAEVRGDLADERRRADFAAAGRERLP